ncbi:MAG: lytic transglycosylase domain-containing protein [Comamonas sp.]
MRWRSGLWIALATGLAAGLPAVAAAQSPPATTPKPAPTLEQCIAAAARYHQVHPQILWAILKVESNLQAQTLTRNRNGTRDHGMGGINTIHLPELDRHGVAPHDLQDPCVNTYVAAWYLRRQMLRHGNTWFGVAAYHSVTPYFNQRYQILLRNALVRAQVLAGRTEPVPPLLPEKSQPNQAVAQSAGAQIAPK